MQITYSFADGTSSVVEVNEEIGSFIVESRREERNADRRHRYHCYSLAAIVFEGKEYGACDAYTCEDDSEERKRKIKEAMEHLTETQSRRLMLRSKGLTYRDIAEVEGVDVKSAEESVKAARKNFLKYFA